MSARKIAMDACRQLLVREVAPQPDKHVMTKPFEPPSGFLRDLIQRKASLSKGRGKEVRIAELINLTRNGHVENRDWATFLLSQDDVDTPAVREALLVAAADESPVVRAEAIWGLAKRDRLIALPLLQKELSRSSVMAPLLEAAALAADESLVADLRAFEEPSGDKYLDSLVLSAIAACGG